MRKEVQAKKSQTERVEKLLSLLDDSPASAEKYARHIKTLKREVHKMPPKELAEWRIERHDMFVIRKTPPMHLR